MKHESPIRILAEGGAAADVARARPRRKLDPVLDGLRAAHKRLPCSLLYDARGAALFERICTLDAYYPTRTEIALLEQHVAELAADVGPGARVIEPGSCDGVNTR